MIKTLRFRPKVLPLKVNLLRLGHGNLPKNLQALPLLSASANQCKKSPLLQCISTVACKSLADCKKCDCELVYLYGLSLEDIYTKIEPPLKKENLKLYGLRLEDVYGNASRVPLEGETIEGPPEEATLETLFRSTSTSNPHR